MKPLVNISSRAYAVLLSEVSRLTNKETGGVFIGYRDKDEWYIVETTFSGPDAEHKSAFFQYDYKYTEYEIDRLKDIYNTDLYILGLWHSHVTSSDFSFADDKTNEAFARLNEFGAISAIFDVCEEKLRFFEVNLPLSYSEVAYCICSENKDFYRKEM